MQPCDTLILADWCIPVEPDGQVLADHAVAVTEGRIEAVLPAAEARQRYRPGVLVERPGHVLIPGLVNAHTHAAMTLLRGLADDMPLEAWLREAIWPVEKRWVSAEMVRDGTRLAIAEMLLSGCTCFSDQYFYPEIVAETAAELHMRAMVGTPVIDLPNAWSADAAEALSKGADLVHDRYVDHPLVASCFAPHSTGTMSDESFRRLRIMADQLDRRVQIHLHESAGEIAESLEKTGKRPFARLEEAGLVNASLLAVHAVHLDEREIESCAASGVAVAHCPRSNLKLADGIAPVQSMLDAGVTVALGTDGPASNNVLNLFGEMRTAALLAKVKSDDASALPAVRALRMATLDGADALGLADCTGSLSPGKWADIVCVDFSALNCQPLYDPLSQLVYAAEAHQVRDVWVGGRHQVENGELALIDTDELSRRTTEWQRRLGAVERRKSA